MKNLLSLCAILLFGMPLFSQTTIYSETFETGNSFTLNSSDMGAATIFNTWLMNNTYAGGSGTLVCMGFPFTFTVVNTPAQPGGITNSPSSNYMHISAQAAIASGINCASYIPADGTCVMAESNFAKMTAPVSTSGYSNVNFSFWRMCAGSADAYGQLYYSLDGGTTWVLKQNTINNITNWAQSTLTDAAWDNQPSLMFAFRFVNNLTSTAADPAFSVDDIKITGTGATNSITTTGNILPNSWCQGDNHSMNVAFNAMGVYTTGNVFTAQISNATGSFASPVSIGTLNSSASGSQVVSAIVPGGVVAGSGYRVRVVASTPSINGTDNGANLTIHQLPTVTMSLLAPVCSNGPALTLVGGSPASGTYSGPGVSGGVFSPSTAGAGAHGITYTYIDANGCQNTATQSISVNSAPTVSLSPLGTVCINAASFTLSGGTPAGGTFSGPGVSGGVFNPATAGVGVHAIVYTYTDSNACQGSVIQDIEVDGCVGLEELETSGLMVYPNPANKAFAVFGVSNIELMQIVDFTGKVIRRVQQEGENYSVDGIPSGLYLVLIQTSNGNYQTKLRIN